MRVSLEIIREEGERVSTHSKFYIWNDMLFEPSTYRGKPTKSYKPVLDADRITKALQRHGEIEDIPKVSSVIPSSYKTNSKKTFKHERCNILDL